MSIFDKYNANPYITTYAGAPIKEYQQTASALQQRMDQNIAARDQIEIMMNDIEASNVDEDFKKSKIAEYQKALEEISENPEYATSKVRSLSKRFKMDEDFKEMKQSKDRITKLQEEIREGDYSDFQTKKFTDALLAYQTPDEEGKAGLAAGRTFGDVNFYEELPINEKVDDQVKGILGEKYGSAQLDPETGMISTVEGEITSEERVRGSIRGALYGNKQISRQLNDEAMLQFERQGLSEGLNPEQRKEAYNEFFANYVEDTYVSPALSKFVRGSEKTGLKNTSSSNSSNGSKGSQILAFTSGDKDVVQTSELTQDIETEEIISNYYDLGNQLELGEFETGSQLTNALNKQKIIEGGLRATLANETIIKDPEFRNFLSQEEDITKIFDIIRPKGNIDELNLAVEQIPGLDSDWSDPEVRERYNSILSDIEENHGKEVKTKVARALFPDYTRTDASKAAKNQLVEMDDNYSNAYGDAEAIVKDPRFQGLLLENQEKIRKQKIQELREEYPELARKAFPTLERTKKYLRSRGYDEDKIDSASKKLSNIISDGGFTKSYQDNMEEGIADVGVNRSSVNIDSLFKSKDNRDGISGSLQKVFNFQDLAKSDFESMKIRGEDGKLRQPEEDDFQGYQLNKLEVTEVDNMGGLGLVNVEIPHLESGELPLKMSVDISNPRFSAIRDLIVQRSLNRAKNTNDPGQKEIFMGVAYQYQGRDIIMELNEYSSEAAEGMQLELSDDLITEALGPITFEKDDSGFIFYTADGNTLFPSGKSFENSNLAYAALREKAMESFSTAGKSLTPKED